MAPRPTLSCLVSIWLSFFLPWVTSVTLFICCPPTPSLGPLGCRLGYVPLRTLRKETERYGQGFVSSPTAALWGGRPITPVQTRKPTKRWL